MAFTIRLCPYCGGEISAEETAFYVCKDCEKRTFRSRSNTKVFLANKPCEKEFTEILRKADDSPKEALSQIDEIISEAEEPFADMFFVRGIIYAAMGEEGKAHNDWKKGLDLLQDLRFIDAYIITVCDRITDLICMKEREFMQFNPIEYIDQISTEFSLKARIPCRGIFYITVYRNFKIRLQGGELDGETDLYFGTIPIILKRILAYGRDFRTVCTIIDEILEDYDYNPDTYEEDDNMQLHVCQLIRDDYRELSADFSDAHITQIFKHWNDENMFELEYWVDEIMKSIDDSSILQTLRKLASSDEEDFKIEEAVRNYTKKYLLLDEATDDSSQES